VDRSRISIVPNPVDLERIQSLALDSRELLPLPPHIPMILAVGRLSPQKDFATLLRAFSEVRRMRDAVLVILGEGDERHALSKLASDLKVSDSVMMPGFVANPFVYMKRAAVFVLSSRYEGLPNVLLHAVALGTPAVSTDCPSGPREILDDGRWGRLVPVGKPNEMARAIIEGLDGRLQGASLPLFEERFGVEPITRRYIEVLLPHWLDSQLEATFP
jgi:glycosyltransferase involved in cell wall biosynthesis